MELYDLGHHVLDRRVVDRHGRLLGRVDDLELSDEDPPQVTAILLGPEALGRRLGGLLGTFVAGFARLRPDGSGPPRIDWGHVTGVGTEVETDLDADSLGFPHGERWLREHVVDRLPASSASSESGPAGDTAGRDQTDRDQGGER